jgi:hypothetical protein
LFAPPQGLFAAYRVLHRLLAPRHSPYALSSLTIGISQFQPSRKNTACVLCGTEKLPFAGYSVVKDPSGSFAPRTPRLGRSRGPFAPLRSRGLARFRSLAIESIHDRTQNFPGSPKRLWRQGGRARSCCLSAAPRTLNSTSPAPTAAVLACQPKPRRHAAFGEGWWRIPGSNR